MNKERWTISSKRQIKNTRVMRGLVPYGALLTVCSVFAFPHCSIGVPEQLVRRELQDILSRPEYNRTFGPSSVQQLSARLWEKLTDLLSRLVGLFSFGGGTAGRIASIVFACLVIAAFAALILLVVSKLLELRRKRAPADDGTVQESCDLPSANLLIREAANLADAGDYRGAFRCAYMASISHLDEIGALRFERSRTNWEYLDELDRRGHTAARKELWPLTLDFDRKFYGREECTRRDYERAAAAYNALSTMELAA